MKIIASSRFGKKRENRAIAESQALGTLCPIARSMAVVGDRWTILIIRELFAGCSRFDAIQAQTGFTSQMLADRLKRLEADGMIERRVYNERPLRYEYVLTQMGREFSIVVFALRAWGETWCKGPDEPPAARMMHRACGTEVDLFGHCSTCKTTVVPTELDARLSPEYLTERRERQNTYTSEPT